MRLIRIFAFSQSRVCHSRTSTTISQYSNPTLLNAVKGIMSNLISQSTLDTFRVQVFRPRLALFVLILLVTTSTSPSTTSTTPATPSTFFSFPTPSLNLLLHPNVLPTFTPLTILLAVRLASMVIEDHIQQSTSTPTTSTTSSTSISHPILINFKPLLLISSLAFLSLISATTWFTKALHNWAIHFDPDLGFELPILPLNLIVMIEVSRSRCSREAQDEQSTAQRERKRERGLSQSRGD